MSTAIATQLTSRGLLIPRSALREWLNQGIKVIKEQQRIVIRPRPAPRTEREQALQILETAGLLLPAEPPPPSSESLAAQAPGGLARRFSVGQPLSEIVIEEREERW